MYALLIKNGIIVDGLGETAVKADLAVEDGKIVKIAPGIEGEATSVVDAEGCYVTPGLIDHHAHLYPFAPIGISPDAACFAAGVTTAVDAGSTGCNTYGERRPFIKMTKLRIRAYLNVCSAGLDSLPVLEDVNPEHMEPERIKEVFEASGSELLGLKLRTSRPIVGEKGLGPLKGAVAMADKLELPLMIHITDPPVPMDELLACLRPGDVVTHMYQNKGFTILDKETGKVMEAAWKARERGILFEAADAREHFSFEVSRPAILEGFLPDFIATDLTKYSMHLRPTSFNLAMQLSKYCQLGISFPQAIRRCTWNPAVSMGLSDQIGSLKEGKEADIAVFRPAHQENVFGDRTMADPNLTTVVGNLIYQPVLTVRAGQMVYRDVTF